MVGSLVNKELERISKLSDAALCYYPGIYLKGLRKTRNILSQNRKCLDRNSNPAPPKCRLIVLRLHTPARPGSYPVVGLVLSNVERSGFSLLAS
jgi:hypothetical protein